MSLRVAMSPSRNKRRKLPSILNSRRPQPSPPSAVSSKRCLRITRSILWRLSEAMSTLVGCFTWHLPLVSPPTSLWTSTKCLLMSCVASADVYQQSLRNSITINPGYSSSACQILCVCCPTFSTFLSRCCTMTEELLFTAACELTFSPRFQSGICEVDSLVHVTTMDAILPT